MSRMTAFLCLTCAAVWPSCSCTSTSTKTAKCETVATSGLGNRLLKPRWFVGDEGLNLRTITRWLTYVFFSVLDHGSPHRTTYQSRQWSMILLRSISPTPGSQVFILVFDVPSPKCFAQTGDRHSCQASNTGSALAKTSCRQQEQWWEESFNLVTPARWCIAQQNKHLKAQISPEVRR